MHPQYFYRQKKVGPLSTSDKELRDLFWAWIVISLAFTIVMAPREASLWLIVVFFISLVAVGTGFIFHEMAHKIVAQRYGCFAEFRGFPRMWGIALLSSLMGFIFAAPGAVMISGHVDRRRNGIISLAGPTANLVVASLFLLLTPILGGFAVFGYRINGWLAFFNLIPFANLDGAKVLMWNKKIYFAIAIVAFFFAFLL